MKRNFTQTALFASGLVVLLGSTMLQAQMTDTSLADTMVPSGAQTSQAVSSFADVPVPQPGVPAQPQMPASTGAQPGSQMSALTILAGDILEVMPVHTIPSPSYAWILTRDRQFIRADRAATFQFRPTEPGTYTLTGEITGGDRVTRMRRVFTIVVQQRLPGTQPSSAATDGQTLVRTVPVTDDKTVVLAADSPTLLLTPTGNYKTFNLDLDTTVDRDANGKMDDDVDNTGTLSQSDGTPLLLWFVDALTERSIAVSALKGDGSYSTQQLNILSFETARQRGQLGNIISIQAANTEGRTYQFSAVFQPNTKPDDALLYSWSFGDGSESLETQPTHTFPEGTNFTVTVSVRNLLTGQDIASSAKEISIGGAVTSQASSVSASSVTSNTSVSSSQKSENSGEGVTSRLMAFIPLLAGFIGAIVIGLILVGVISMIRKRGVSGGTSTSLQKHFEQMEAKLVQKQQTPAPAPTQVTPSRPLPPPSVAEKELEKRSDGIPTPPPVVEAANAPSWLKQGLQGKPDLTASATPKVPAAPPAAPAPTPPPVPAPKPVAPAPTPVPTATPAPSPKPFTPPAPPVPAPTPSPAPAVAPKPVVPAPVTPLTPATPPVEPKSEAPTPALTSAPVVTQKPEITPVAPPVPPAPVVTPQVTPSQPAIPPSPAPQPVPAPIAPPKTVTPPSPFTTPAAAMPAIPSPSVTQTPAAPRTPVPAPEAKPLPAAPSSTITTPARDTTPSVATASPTFPMAQTPPAIASNPSAATQQPITPPTAPKDETVAIIRAEGIQPPQQDSGQKA